jgi:uncharacterized protein YndB with AHSA1/START domain
MKRYESHQFIPRDPSHCFATISDPLNMPEWFKGAHSITTANGYPQRGGTIAWLMGRNYRFEARVLTNEPPSRLVLKVRTSSGDSVVTNSFTAEENGTRYSKVVEVEPHGFFGLLVPLFLPGSVRREVALAAALASRP